MPSRRSALADSDIVGFVTGPCRGLRPPTYNNFETCHLVGRHAGIPVGVSVSPQIPFINDDMERVLEAAHDAGATSAFYVVLRLPWELAPLFRQWLDLHYPDRAARVMARMHDLRGGKDYDASFATRRSGQGIWADLIAQRFDKACRRLGLNRRRRDWNVDGFRPPSTVGQMGLF